jgi:hypothetical protein
MKRDVDRGNARAPDDEDQTGGGEIDDEERARPYCANAA